jgi:cell division protease FtsH
VPRGVAALGYAQYLPKEMYIRTTEHLMDDMCMSLGGRAVEELVFGKISTGALSDLQHVTRMAYAMVSMYGMSAAVGNISFYDPQNENSFSKPYSEETGKMIDDEVRKVVDSAYQRVKQLLSDKQDAVRTIAEELLKKEVLFKDDMERLLGKRPYDDAIASEEPFVPDTILDPNL